jgi:hypothetical protein
MDVVFFCERDGVGAFESHLAQVSRRRGRVGRATHKLLHSLVDDLAGVGALEENASAGILDFFWFAGLERTFRAGIARFPGTISACIFQKRGEKFTLLEAWKKKAEMM